MEMNRRCLFGRLAGLVAGAVGLKAAPIISAGLLPKYGAPFPGKTLQMTIAGEYTAICHTRTLWVTEEMMKDCIVQVDLETL